MRPEYVVHTAQEIIKIRRAAHMTALARDRICSLVHSGMTTKDLDNIAGEVIRSMGGEPAFLNYRGYPGNICISVNDEVGMTALSSKAMSSALTSESRSRAESEIRRGLST